MSPSDLGRHYPLFSVLDPARINAWLAAAQLVAIEAGDTLFQAGTPGKHIFIVQSGRVRLLRESSRGRDVPLGVVGAGELFGEYALLPPCKNTATCRASEPTSLMRLPLPPLQQVVAEQPLVHQRLKAWLRLHAVLSHLRGSAFLGFLSGPSVMRMIDLFEPLRFRPGDVLQAEGFNADRFFHITSGAVAFRSDEAICEGGPQALKAGDCFGSAALLGNPLATAEALDEVACVAVRRAMFESSAAARRQSIQTFDVPTPDRRLYPWVAQAQATDCAAACLAMIVRFHGLSASTSLIHAQLKCEDRGSTLAGVERAAVAVGFHCRVVRVSLDHLAEATLPAIAHLASEHYVVLYEFCADAVIVGDPIRGIVSLSVSEFAQVWSGHLAILIRPPVSGGKPGQHSTHSSRSPGSMHLT